MKKITLLMAAFLFAVGMSAQCVDYVDGPYIDFNSMFGGAPSPNGAAVEITAFEIWKSEAYLMDNIIAGESYTFSGCNGPSAGSWGLDFAVGPYDGTSGLTTVDAFGLDVGSTCELTFTASASGTYLIIINEDGNCGIAGQVDNGYPKMAWVPTLSTNDLAVAGFNYFYNVSSKQLTLSANEAFTNISLYNLIGQEVIAKNLSTNNEVVDLSTITNGVYIGTANVNGKVATFKIIKR